MKLTITTKLIIPDTRERLYQVSLLISCSDPEHEIDIPLIQQFLYDYVYFLADIRKNSNKNFFRVHLSNSETDGLNFIIRRGILYLEDRRKELFIGDIQMITEESIQDLKNLLSNFPWKDYLMDEEEEMNDLNEMMW